MRSRFLASASLCARYSARAFVLVVGLGVAGEGVRVTHRTRHLGERRMLRSPRLATEHIPDGRGRQPGEHGEIVLLDAALLPKRSEVTTSERAPLTAAFFGFFRGCLRSLAAPSFP